MRFRTRTPSSVGWLFCLVGSLTCSAGAVSAQSRQFVLRGSIPAPAGFELGGFATLDGTRAFVSSGTTLTVFDVSDPAAPTEIGAYDFSHVIWGFRVVGSRVYVAADTFGLGILDISGTGDPRLAGSFTTLGQAKNVAVSETTALVADHLDGVVVLDVSTPSEPVQVGSGFVDGFATDVAISGPLMFASDRPMGLYVLDASEPAAPELTVVPQSTVTGGDWYAQLELVHPEPGPPLVVLVTNGLLQLFDISDPRAPVQLSTYSPPGGARRAAFAGTLAYIASAAAPATGEAGMVVVDLSDPSSPRVVGTYKTETPAFDVAVADSLVLLATPIEILILEQMP